MFPNDFRCIAVFFKRSEALVEGDAFGFGTRETSPTSVPITTKYFDQAF